MATRSFLPLRHHGNDGVSTDLPQCTHLHATKQQRTRLRREQERIEQMISPDGRLLSRYHRSGDFASWPVLEQVAR